MQYHDTRQNGIQYNDTLHNDIQHDDIQHMSNHHNDTQQKGTFAEFLMLSVASSQLYADCHYTECRYADWTAMASPVPV